MEIENGLTVTMEYEPVDDGVYVLPRIRNNGTQDSGQISDVLLDSSGVMLGCIIIFIIYRSVNRKKAL